MKNLIFVNGTMGVGKTTTCRELQKIMPQNVFLDGDWCWDMMPFVVNDETKNMVIDNITYLLGNYISCLQYQNIIFCWVMDEQSIIDSILERLDTKECNTEIFTLIAQKDTIVKRLGKDISAGIRTESVIERSVAKLQKYDKVNSVKIDSENLTPAQVAEKIASHYIRIYK